MECAADIVAHLTLPIVWGCARISLSPLSGAVRADLSVAERALRARHRRPQHDPGRVAPAQRRQAREGRRDPLAVGQPADVPQRRPHGPAAFCSTLSHFYPRGTTIPHVGKLLRTFFPALLDHVCQREGQTEAVMQCFLCGCFVFCLRRLMPTLQRAGLSGGRQRSRVQQRAKSRQVGACTRGSGSVCWRWHAGRCCQLHRGCSNT